MYTHYIYRKNCLLATAPSKQEADTIVQSSMKHARDDEHMPFDKFYGVRKQETRHNNNIEETCYKVFIQDGGGIEDFYRVTTAPPPKLSWAQRLISTSWF